MTLTWADYAAQHFTRRARTWATPGELAQTLDPPRYDHTTSRSVGTTQTPALDLIDTELVRLLAEPDGRLIVSMPPQEGKSSRAARDFPIWALHHNNDLRIVTASYAQSLANRNGRTIRNTITAHPELGLAIADDNGAVSEWQLAGHDGGVLSVGRGAGITGRPADLLIIDDPIKDRKEADSQLIRDGVLDWWTDSLSTRLSPGASVVLILTRWHEDDLAARLTSAADGHLWRVVNIPAQADHKPEQGETDPLGRQPGEFMESARRRTREQWEAIKVRAGARTWAALYQGRPAPAAGGLLQRDWWQFYSHAHAVTRTDGTRWVANTDVQIVQSWDLAFKSTDHSDYVVGQVWMRQGNAAVLLDQVRGRWDFPETCRQIVALSARWPQAALKIVEDKANGPAVIAALRNQVSGLVPEQVNDSKIGRASAVAPFIEAGNVVLPDPTIAPWISDLLEEAAAFPNGKHDDQIDAMTQALNRLLVSPLYDDTDDTASEPWQAYDAIGYYASPY